MKLSAVVNDSFPEYRHIAERVDALVLQFFLTAVPPARSNQIRYSNYYYYYPFLFHSGFPCADAEALVMVAYSGILYLKHALNLDMMIDEPNLKRVERPFLSAQLHEEALRILMRYFPPDSVFWSELASYNREFTASMLEEHKSHYKNVSRYADGEYFRLIKGKSALSRGTTAAVALLGGAPERLPVLNASQDFFNAALTVYDDIKDWRDDFCKGRYSYMITRAILEAGIDRTDAIANSPGVAESVGRHLYYSGLLEEAAGSALDWCAKAIECVDGFGVPDWVRLVRMLSGQIETLKRDLAQIRVQTILRSQGYLSEGLDQLITAAGQFLLAEHKKGYPDTLVRVKFNSMGAGAKIHTNGSIFERAVIADALLDLQEAGNSDGARAIEENIQWLVSSRLTRVRGGWNYFPTLTENAPDADSLGQILQALVRSGYTDIGALVDDPIQLVFEKNVHENGSFETWIVDRDVEDDTTRAMLRTIRHSWGTGADVEVVANLAYALTLYDPQGFRSEIRKAAAWVEAQQQPAGNWIPSWYLPSAYGTYTAVRLLTRVLPGSRSLDAIYDYLATSQRDDGGFGDEHSTPLETALAVLTLTLLRRPEAQSMVDDAIRFLELTTAEDGGWDASRFIKFDRVNRPTADGERRTQALKSRTLTTAYVLKALLAGRKEPCPKQEPAAKVFSFQS